MNRMEMLNAKVQEVVNAQYVELDKINYVGIYHLTDGFTINIIRKGYDKNGNPKYHLYMAEELIDKIKQTKGHVGRVLTNKNGIKYLTFTSYNFTQTLKHTFKQCGILK